MASDREELARLISEGVDGMSREAYEEASQDYRNEMLEGADHILASDWLRERDRRIQAEALRVAHIAFGEAGMTSQNLYVALLDRAVEIGGDS